MPQFYNHLPSTDKAMKEAGMEKCYYVDVKTFSLLRGTYKRTTLILYGE